MKTKVILIILTLSGYLSMAQTKLADDYFKDYDYVKAITLYEEALNNNKEKNKSHILTRLGDCHYNNSRVKIAAGYYERAFTISLTDSIPIDKEHIYKYIETQRSIGTIESFKNEQLWMEKFKNQAASDSRVNSEVTNINTYEQLKDISKVYIEVKNLENINSKLSDFGAYEFENKLYYATNNILVDSSGNNIYSWNGNPYLDIYTSDVTVNNGSKTYESGTLINNEGVITNYHESSVAITKDGKTMYFTRDEVNKRFQLKHDKKGTSQLMIYKATVVEGQWVADQEPLSFNDEKFSTGHPVLSADQKILYFVSNRLGGFGQTDIYKVDILEDGSYANISNLGDNVNSEGREMFPFITKDNTLYFSSDGYINLGSLDIYKTNILNDPKAQPENLAAPFNSGADDFAFFMNADSKSGYFSSNRDGGKGDDDIYSFLEYECQQTISGTLTEKIEHKQEESNNAFETEFVCDKNKIIAGATVELIDQNGAIIEKTTTAADGSYHFETAVACDSSFKIRGSKIDYSSEVEEVKTGDVHNFKNIKDFCLELVIIECEVVIENIVFDFDRATIYKVEEKRKLEKLVDIMREFPDMKIIIESHTDYRGDDDYNEQLSLCRAKATRDYLINERHIAAERLPEFYGYGENCPLIAPDIIRGMETREEKDNAHELNRRSVFRIVDCPGSETSCTDRIKGDLTLDEDCKECERFHKPI